jgi:outer membrane protein assembly factor BamA
VRLNVFRQIGPVSRRGKLYAGARYQVEEYRVTQVVPEGVLDRGLVPGGHGSRLTGGGLGLFFDSRDRIFSPRKGVVADVGLWLRNRAVGAGPAGQTTRFDRYVADVASYHALGKRAVLALNYFTSFTVGRAPFNALSLLGGTRRMRGYYEGRYRDQNAALLQSELRVPVYKRLGAVAFGSVGVLGDEQQLLRVGAPKAAYGAGLRFTVNRRDQLNLRLDYGLGRNSSGLYLTIGEAF